MEGSELQVIAHDVRGDWASARRDGISRERESVDVPMKSDKEKFTREAIR